MKISKMLWISLIVLFVFSQGWGMVRAEGNDPQAVLGPGFSYQGYLKDSGGNPLTDTCAFRFQLWDALSGGAQVGGNSVWPNVSVANGYFTASVNAGGEFGTSAFTGQARWLAIAVQCTGDSAYGMLSPRQALTVAPYASYAVAAGRVPWSGVTGTPLQLPTGCSGGQLPKWSGTAWVCSGDNDTTYSAGYGLELAGSTLNVNDNLIQRRVMGACAMGFTIRQVNQDGTVVCQVDSPLNRPVPPMTNVLSTPDSNGDTGMFTSITIGTDGLGLISYVGDTGDLVVAHCSDPACTTVITTTLDSYGWISEATSIAIGADGLGLISYYDGTNYDLKVAHCSDPLCTTAITTTLASSGNVGGSSSIAIGVDGLGLISYGDETNADLKVAHCSNLNCTTATFTTPDSTGDVGGNNSITIGADGLGLISYTNNASHDLLVAHCSDPFCTTAITTTLDSSGDALYGTSITIGVDGLGLISYYSYPSSDLKVAHCSNAACTVAIISTLDSDGNVGVHPSITIGADGLGLISYYYFYNGLKVAHCSDIACTSATLTIVDSTGDVGDYSSITIGADGLGLVSHYSWSSGDLRVAHCSNTFCVPYFRRR